MKQILLTVLIALISLTSSAQNDKSFKSIYDNFSSRNKVECVKIYPKVFAFFIPDSDTTEKAMFKKMDAVMILSAENSDGKDLFKAIEDYMEGKSFEPVMEAKDGHDNVIMYHAPKELLFLATDSTETSAIYISGDIDKALMKAVMEGDIKFK